MRPARTGRMVVGLLVALAGGATAQEAKIEKPQEAILYLATGKAFPGTVHAMNGKEVKFQIQGKSLPSVYSPKNVRAVETRTAVYVYDGDLGYFKPLKKDEPPAEAKVETKPPPMPTLPAERVVTVTGSGKTADDALKDAFRNAVREVVGVYVDAETIQKNDELLSDKVLTFSGGFVTGFDRIEETESNGLVRVKIKAKVEPKKLVAKLKEVSIRVREVQGENIAAEVMTRAEARKNAAALLAKHFEEIPKLIVAEAKKPTAADYDEDDKVLKLAVTTRIDGAKYKTFLTGFQDVLEKVAVSKDFAIVNAKYDSYDKNLNPPWLSGESEFLNGPDLRNLPKGWCLWVVTKSDAQLSRIRFDGYVLESDLEETFSGCFGEMKLHIEFLDADGEVIVEDLRSYGGNYNQIPFGAQVIWHQKNSKYSHAWSSLLSVRDSISFRFAREVWRVSDTHTANVLLSPFIFPDSFSTETFRFRPASTDTLKIPLTPADLRRLKDIRCKVVFRPKKS